MASDTVTIPKNGSEVHLWSRRLDLQTPLRDDELGCLGPDEMLRANKFRFADNRLRFVRRHRHLREVLARYFGTSPALVPLAAPLHQPPRLTWNETVANETVAAGLAASLQISLSSSADRSAVAVARDRPIGVDVELLDTGYGNREAEVQAVAETAFTPAEHAVLETASGDEWWVVFFRIWARKEAFVKALGVGFGRDLMSFDVMTPDHRGASASETRVIDRVADSAAAGYWVRDVPAPPGFVLACCSTGTDWTIVSKENDP